jgi:glutathione-independent formaldehyde dehydrogenase
LDWRRWTDPGDVDQAVLKYNRQLMQAILHDKIQIAKAVNVTVIRLDDAPKGYVDFDKGTAKKFVLDPHSMLAA